ncbi:DHH family phosphoesterase [Tuberibacillus sp. Marseille-P3662]|uniref:DHH family phosphoesterase n=1 Tax=Tuberibacillus sp. Marseille-P3662 TaxID=1965358 RepID=UPI000A1CDA9E|nr:bifunctional oligoribonuclease/PAP phosphatase NrnA [Tuberibacillus sp. Marseille-P3662]
MLKDIFQAIEYYNTIIIHRHVRPDPDALGSQGGLACLIKDHYPNKKVYMVGDDEPSLSFLTCMDAIDDDTYNGALVIVCDTANQERIDDQRYHKGERLIKIDHHPNVDPYGDDIWVDTEASSVSEMIVDMCENNEIWTLSDEAARLLYAGIVGDTGRFLFANTTVKTFKRAAKLIEKQFDRGALHNALYEKKLSLMKLNGYVLQNFSMTKDGVGYLKLPLDVTKAFEVTPSEASLLINAFSDTKGMKAWVFFIEEEDQIRVRFRSKGPVVNQIAARYDGGGHPMAAGATVYQWKETEAVLEDLIDVCQTDQQT